MQAINAAVLPLLAVLVIVGAAVVGWLIFKPEPTEKAGPASAPPESPRRKRKQVL